MKKATIYGYARMCKKYRDANCTGCPMWNKMCNLRVMSEGELDKANEIILNWCEEHPVKTRQDKFLKMFPNAINCTGGVVEICPRFTDKDFKCPKTTKLCSNCYKEYWLAEVDENE